ncbi:Aldose sugar dehydrogenase YliI [Pontiella desulfatans]|uniref:Aldose sugar dehydrogenase YliI n=1 Tax=Pontiella desulfatans TaxID=2750659 RepID=A0A6C2UDF3_PONDE|nr:cytochrome c [Pontiella desulfatans]VGO17919.1 Aldose sugar dehydrogenase YliI [Pontiella desulfatans]
MKKQILFFILLAASSAFGQSAESLYQQHCSHCHGVKFQGGNAQSLVDGIWQFGDSAGHISRNIKFGITHLGMPAYEKSLTDPQIKSLVNYLFEAEKQAGAATPPSPTSLQTQDYDIDVEIWAEGLDIPWNLAFLDDKLALITERPGRLRIMRNGTLNPKPVEGSPSVVAEGQGGLLAVAFDPDYREKGNQWIYLAFSHGLEKKAVFNRWKSKPDRLEY